MDQGQYEAAEAAFDRAILHMENVFAPNENAAKARSKWYKEDCKDFKGEPYERVMAYYYRGLLYLRKADFENARACFKSATLQDAYAEEEQYRADFALTIFLQGWCCHCLGQESAAQDAYREVKALRPDFPIPPVGHNTLVLVETGKAPRKLSDGVGHYVLVYRRGKNFSEKRVRVSVGSAARDAYPMEDIYWQASTRGGRQIESILKGKVAFREQAMTAGTVLTSAGTVGAIGASGLQHGQGTATAVSAGLGLAGAAAYIVAASVRPEADTRQWKNLPDGVHVYTCASRTGADQVRADFLDETGRPADCLALMGALSSTGSSYLAWMRSRPCVVPPDP
jgi:hypothetical protein